MRHICVRHSTSTWTIHTTHSFIRSFIRLLHQDYPGDLWINMPSLSLNILNTRVHATITGVNMNWARLNANVSVPIRVAIGLWPIKSWRVKYFHGNRKHWTKTNEWTKIHANTNCPRAVCYHSMWLYLRIGIVCDSPFYIGRLFRNTNESIGMA